MLRSRRAAARGGPFIGLHLWLGGGIPLGEAAREGLKLDALL